MRNLAVRYFLVLGAVGGLAAPLVVSCSSNTPPPNGVGGSSNPTGAGGGGGMSTGSGGAGGDCTTTACSPPGVLDCSNAVTPNALVTDFSTCSYKSSGGKWGLCPLTGSVYGYNGDGTLPDGSAPSTHITAVDYTTGHNFQFGAMVSPGGYAGAGLQFDSCSNVSTFSGIQFTLTGTTDCALELQFSTFSQRPTSQSTLPGGCNDSAGSCYNYPVAKNLMTPTDTTPITVMVPFTSVNNWTADTAKEVVGLQWQATSPPPSDPDGGTQPPCNVDLRIDDIMFMP